MRQKKILETLAKEFNVTLSYSPKTADKNYLHPQNNAEIVLNGKVIGFMGLVHPVTTEVIDSKINIATVEIDVLEFLEKAKPVSKYYPVSIYQPVTLDFNFVISKNMFYSQIEKVLKDFKTNYVYSFRLVDIYKDILLGANYSYTFKVTIVSNDHTLSGEEIATFHKEFIAYCESNDMKLRQ